MMAHVRQGYSLSTSIDCRCPQCNSNDTRSLETIHANGTRLYESRRSGWSTGRRSLSLNHSVTRGTSVTLAARRAAPPPEPPDWLGAIAVAWIIYSFFLFPFAVAVVLAITTFYSLGAVRGNSTIENHEDATRTWRESFRCRRCGLTFNPYKNVDSFGGSGS